MSKTIAVNLQDDLAARVSELARASDQPESVVIEHAVQAYLAEDADARIALERLQDEGDTIVSADEMRKRLGL